MSDENTGITDEQQLAPDETRQDPTNDPQVGESQQAVGVSEIPDKFRGKSSEDILQAYLHLEKKMSELTSERDHALKEKETVDERYQQLETQYRQPVQQQTRVIEEQVDPFEHFEQRFDDDPKGAIRETLKRQQETLLKAQMQDKIQSQASQASEYYHSQQKENPDFARRETVMKQLASEYADLIKPELLNSPRTIKLLDIASRGRDVSYYEKQAVSRAQKDGLSTLNEKRRSQSESSNSEGDHGTKFSDLPIEEMEKFLGRSDD